jgi:hypothetical protein
MEEARARAYQKVIDELLACSKGQEGSVLERHPDLVDRDLVTAMKQYARILQKQGLVNEGIRLDKLATQLAKTLRGKGFGATTNKDYPPIEKPSGAATDEDYSGLIEILLKAVVKSKGNPARVERILQQNLSLLDERFGKVLQVWAIQKFKRISNQKKLELAELISRLAIDILNFPLGSRANNLEIVIIAYETILTVFTKEAFPKHWALTQMVSVQGGRRSLSKRASTRCAKSVPLATAKKGHQNLIN